MMHNIARQVGAATQESKHDDARKNNIQSQVSNSITTLITIYIQSREYKIGDEDETDIYLFHEFMTKTNKYEEEFTAYIEVI